jgi:signal transduction histidine kinase
MQSWYGRLCRLALGGVFLGLASIVQCADVASQKKILYLTAEGLDHQYFGAAYSAFKEELQKSLPDATVLYVENLDLARFNEAAHKQSLTAWLRTKYANIHFDAIVTAGTPALKFAVETRLWPDVPTYFSNTNDAIVRTIALPPNFTGQTFTVNFGQTVALIRKVLPATKRIVLVGNAPNDDIYRPFIAKELARFVQEFAFTDLRGKSIEEVLSAVANLDEDTVIYRTGLSRDASGRIYDPFSVIAITASAANRPMFVDYTPFIGRGTLGGVAIDPDAQGRNAARKVTQLLNGADPVNMPVARLDFHPTFDWRQLKRWQIAQADLPPGSRVWFYAPSLWERYRWQLAATLGIIGLLSTLVLALLFERRHRAIAVAQARARLAELAHLNRNATALVYSGAIAHELNQPLAAILANAQAARLMLAAVPPALGEVSEILDDIERDDQRAAELIRSMRGLLKKGDTAHELLDINSVVSQAVRFIRPEAKVRGVALRMALPAQAATVTGDRVQLQQVLINLIINAMEAMADLSPSARRVEIAVSTGMEEGVAVSVSDAGPGFSADVSAAFTAFVTTKVHGTGLGLAITAALVREHGGTISASNIEGSGARVTFILPRVVPDEQRLPEAQIRSPAWSAAA